MKVEVRRKEEAIREKQQFLDNEIENNQEQEKKISIAERTSSKLRRDLQAVSYTHLTLPTNAEV